MKILLIHHLETMWESGYNRFGTSFEQIAENVLEHIENADRCPDSRYDHVILTRFEDTELDDDHWSAGLGHLVDTVHDYAYGWESESVDDWESDSDWTEGGCHSEIVLVPDWVKNLKGADVDLCGAFDGECIEDMEIALEAAAVKFNRLESLII